MAFTTRSRRDITLSQTETNPRVGPGSYSLSYEHRVQHGYAPFSSTAPRKLGSDTQEFVTPGPGTYYSERRTEKASISSSNFKSLAPRFREHVTDEPGPGAYDVVQPWVKPRTSPPPPARDRLVSWVRISTVPSIPAATQSYGYEDGPNGELIQQKPTIPGHTGRGADLPGPGEYTPTIKAVARSAPAPAWSRSRAPQRPQHRADTTPGPGSYTVDVSPKRAASTGRRAAPFLSRSSRGFQHASAEEDSTPGPGSYQLPDPFRKEPVPEDLQFFGSTARRFVDSAPAKSTPGPGTYTDPRTAVRSQKKLTLVDHGPFDSTAPRFHSPTAPTAAEVPGPGAYDPPPVPAGAAVGGSSIRTRTVGAFGSRSERFRSPPPAPAPGPGAYDPEAPENVSPVAAWQRRQPSSAFASTVQRIAPPQPGTAPPPGAYDVRGSFLQRSFNRKGVHIPTAPRQDLAPREAKLLPGPGAYDTTVRPLSPTHFAPSAAFASQGARFQEPKPAPAPGPGAYQVRGSFVKRSFNVTVDNPIL